MSFIPMKALEEAIESGNRKLIQIAIGHYLSINPSDRKEIQNVVDYVKNKGYDNLFEPEKGETSPRSEWNDEYLSRMITKLMYNFSEKGLWHIVDVAEFLENQKNNSVVSPNVTSLPSKSSIKTNAEDNGNIKFGPSAESINMIKSYEKSREYQKENKFNKYKSNNGGFSFGRTSQFGKQSKEDSEWDKIIMWLKIIGAVSLIAIVYNFLSQKH